MNKERAELAGRNVDTPYLIKRYSADGTRYFCAQRVCRSWSDDKGNSMPFGGGSYWVVSYGKVMFRSCKDPFGGVYYELCDGKRFGVSNNGTEIPARVGTKQEVLKVLEKIGIF